MRVEELVPSNTHEIMGLVEAGVPPKAGDGVVPEERLAWVALFRMVAVPVLVVLRTFQTSIPPPEVVPGA